MSMRLLIVDDEEEVRSGIRGMIDWEGNGIEVCGEAEDGVQALAIIREAKPEILLMDIRMPELNGLQVAEAMQREGHASKAILLSGYDDFAFAQQALKFGVSEYLLKPCMPDEILAAVLKTAALIREESEQREKYADLQAMLESQMPFLKERFLLKCLRGELPPAENPREGFALYGITLPAAETAAALVRIDEYGALCGDAKERDIAYWRFSVRSTAERFLGTRLAMEFVDDQDDFALIAHLASGEDEAALAEGLSRMQEALRGQFGFTASVGIGRSYPGIGQLHLSYSEARQAMEARFARGDGCLVKYEELSAEDPGQTVPSYPFTEEKQILHSVKNGNQAALERQVDAFLEALAPPPDSPSREHVVRCCMALLLSLYHLCLETRSNPDDVFGRGLASIDALLGVPTLRQLKDNVLETTNEVCRKINSRKSGHKTVEQAVAYIQANFAGELTLETVANQVYVNPNYFCLLFKQSMGVNFIDYVHQIRIGQACEGLAAYPYKTYEIAAKVGYANEKYFCQIFKKLTGLTPSQYRDRYGSANLR
ncbi:response regulator [Paenibacillus sacheonensis]|uniref:Response regulator n=1 Tax=Paenibacillus sacheonensis TaxID=742054 RepID=A0A7X4YRP8_9BACL|nr:response regulator [Paenibacillus sacheonensis]MBM7567576.1 two-component system response regulator YesN [Paenibacillus sacheonensis]NBC71321.1 response regulator [Paenibacillus sacheonensis]